MPRYFEKDALATLLVAAFLWVLPRPVLACEPLPPLLVLFVLPSLATGTVTGWLGVLAGIAMGLGVKCGIFAYCEPAISKGRALWVMGLANIVTTFVGFFVIFALSTYLTFPIAAPLWADVLPHAAHSAPYAEALAWAEFAVAISSASVPGLVYSLFSGSGATGIRWQSSALLGAEASISLSGTGGKPGADYPLGGMAGVALGSECRGPAVILWQCVAGKPRDVAAHSWSGGCRCTPTSTSHAGLLVIMKDRLCWRTPQLGADRRLRW
jgi:hypothetical protein